jgi:hypothetical protein
VGDRSEDGDVEMRITKCGAEIAKERADHYTSFRQLRPTEYTAFTYIQLTLRQTSSHNTLNLCKWPRSLHLSSFSAKQRQRTKQTHNQLNPIPEKEEKAPYQQIAKSVMGRNKCSSKGRQRPSAQTCRKTLYELYRDTYTNTNTYPPRRSLHFPLC